MSTLVEKSEWVELIFYLNNIEQLGLSYRRKSMHFFVLISVLQFYSYSYRASMRKNPQTGHIWVTNLLGFNLDEFIVII
jgi:hypothetical protein